jgi:CO dehydrogenase/acetyl-CoA synthase epsilon subunit
MIGSESLKNIAKLQVTQAISKKFTVNAIVNYSNQKLQDYLQMMVEMRD